MEAGTRVAVVSEDAEEVHRSSAELAVLADPAAVCAELARALPARDGDAAAGARRATAARRRRAPARRCAPVTSSPRSRSACRANATVIEECPSNRPELLVRLPARDPLGS